MHFLSQPRHHGVPSPCTSIGPRVLGFLASRPPGPLLVLVPPSSRPHPPSIRPPVSSPPRQRPDDARRSRPPPSSPCRPWLKVCAVNAKREVCASHLHILPFSELGPKPAPRPFERSSPSICHAAYPPAARGPLLSQMEPDKLDRGPYTALRLQPLVLGLRDANRSAHQPT